MSEVVVTTQKMYDLLISIDRRLTEAMTVQANHTKLLSDHEDRLRTVESQEKLDSSLQEVTKDVADLTTQVRAMQMRVWTIPSLSAVVAVAAVLLTFFRGA